MELEVLLKLSPQEMLAHNEKPVADELRHKQQIYYEQVQQGMELPKYIYGTTPTHLFRWSAAIENFHRIHYDLDFATNHDKTPGLLVQGLLEAERGTPVPQGLDFARRLGLESQNRTSCHAGPGRRAGYVGTGYR